MSENLSLFDDIETIPWLAEWQNMPEYDVQDLAPKYQLIINFSCAEDVQDFSKLIDQNISANGSARQMKSVWFPEQEIGRMMNKRYKDES